MQERNIGVSIGIPEPYDSELQGWRERLGDPNASAVPPHITLLPPTTFRADLLPALEEHLGRVAEGEQRFDIHLRGSGTFRPISPVVFVQLATGVANCERLQQRIRSGVAACQLRFPYHPHVTVAHNLDDDALDEAYDALASYEARFSVWGFTMFEQGPDGVWRPQRDFAFGTLLPGPSAAVGQRSPGTA